MNGVPEIHIDLITPKDLDRLWDIEQSSFTDPWSRNSLKEELENPYGSAYAARTSTGLQGYLLLRRVLDEWTIMNFAVDPARRGKGVGSALLKFAIDKAREMDLSRITLEVNEKNTAAKRLYSAHGFQVVGFRPGYYDNGKSGAILMDLVLESE